MFRPWILLGTDAARAYSGRVLRNTVKLPTKLFLLKVVAMNPKLSIIMGSRRSQLLLIIVRDNTGSYCVAWLTQLGDGCSSKVAVDVVFLVVRDLDAHLCFFHVQHCRLPTPTSSITRSFTKQFLSARDGHSTRTSLASSHKALLCRKCTLFAALSYQVQLSYGKWCKNKSNKKERQRCDTNWKFCDVQPATN